MIGRFIILNGNIEDSQTDNETKKIFLNETFRLEERIWFCNGNLPLFDDHIFLLKEHIKLLNLDLPQQLIDKKELHRVIIRLINKNKAFKTGLIRILIICDNRKTNVLITCIPSESENFELKKHGLLVSFSRDLKFSDNPFNIFKFHNSQFWNSMKYKSSDSRFDGHIILNERKEITEYPASNIYFLKENILYTPSPETGCFIEPLREKILEAATILNFRVVETPKLDEEFVLDMDEAFIAGESSSMQKIMGINNKRFTHTKTKLINAALNRLLLDQG